MAGVRVDVAAILTGTALPFTSISDRLVKAYRKHLFGKATPRDLPDSAEIRHQRHQCGVRGPDAVRQALLGGLPRWAGAEP